MLDLIIWAAIFAVSLAVLIKSSDYFVESAEKLGVALGMPAFIVGVTIVAIGTSLPELSSSIFAVLKGSTEIVASNVVGSNVANIFLVLGLTAVIAGKVKTKYDLMRVDMPMLVGSAFLLAVTLWDGALTLAESAVLIAALTIYLYYTLSLQKKRSLPEPGRRAFSLKDAAVLVLSAVFIYLGAKYTIESLITFSGLVGIGTELLTISALAIGTSLPELAVSVKAARKGRAEMAMGNVLGSNIFNALAVMAIPAVLGSLVVPQAVLSIGLPVMIISTIMYLVIAQDREITEWEGWFLILFYGLFLAKILGIF